MSEPQVKRFSVFVTNLFDSRSNPILLEKLSTVVKIFTATLWEKFGPNIYRISTYLFLAISHPNPFIAFLGFEISCCLKQQLSCPDKIIFHLARLFGLHFQKLTIKSKLVISILFFLTRFSFAVFLCNQLFFTSKIHFLEGNKS